MEYKDINHAVVKITSGNRTVMVSYDESPLLDNRFHIWGYNGDGTSFSSSYEARDAADEAFVREKKRLAPVFHELAATILTNLGN